jgi:hypothetical protein
MRSGRFDEAVTAQTKALHLMESHDMSYDSGNTAAIYFKGGSNLKRYLLTRTHLSFLSVDLFYLRHYTSPQTTHSTVYGNFGNLYQIMGKIDKAIEMQVKCRLAAKAAGNANAECLVTNYVCICMYVCIHIGWYVWQ